MIETFKRVWTAAWVGVTMGVSQGILSALATWEASDPERALYCERCKAGQPKDCGCNPFEEDEDMEDAEVEEAYQCSGDSETCLVDQCTECSERDCPFKCTMHYDDDGCPVCQEAS